ncbi:MAG TPA: 3-hydroxyacyl-CoA dehydrogenase NAD-binding domain-containing protein [Terracidiphilus sp.]|nr:3-hydroxyacyl-CoA dehydrogenase NAD-binding domain-containing protein [Terracidiphilus sp.]
MSLENEPGSSSCDGIAVAIIGAGPLGRWLALAAARAGFRVRLEDVMPSNLHHAQEYLRRELSPANPGAALQNIAFVSSIEDAVREADLAIDCVPDELESKLEILWLLDRMAPPRTVLATPTTNLSIADLAACTYRAEKCVAVALDPREFSRPPESGAIALRTTARTADASVALVRTFWQSLGFTVSVEVTPA